jgi:hypothetical protein
VRNKIDVDAQLPNKLFPTITRQDNLTLPMSMLTRKIASNNTVTRTMSTVLLVDSTTISLMADMPSSKVGRLQGSTIKARTQTTEQLKGIIAEASWQFGKCLVIRREGDLNVMNSIQH